MHYQRCTLLLVATRKNALEDISAASLALHAQKFATAPEKKFVPNFTNRFSRTLQKIWIWKYKAFLWAKYCRIWTETKDIYGKIRISEKGYIRIFYPVYFTCVPSISLISSKNHSSLNKNNTLHWKKLIVKKFLVKQLLWFPNFKNTSFGFLSIARNMSIFRP